MSRLLFIHHDVLGIIVLTFSIYSLANLSLGDNLSSLETCALFAKAKCLVWKHATLLMIKMKMILFDALIHASTSFLFLLLLYRCKHLIFSNLIYLYIVDQIIKVNLPIQDSLFNPFIG